MKQVILSIGLITLLCSANTLRSLDTKKGTKTTHAFIISEESSLFEDLGQEYNKTLANAYDNQIDVAFHEWKQTLGNLNKYLRSNDFDVDNSKLWIKIFWSESGKIDYIATDFKPFSKNKNKEQLTYLLNEYVKIYNQNSVDKQFKVSFSNYGSF